MKIEVIIINLTGMILKMRYCILEQVGAGGEGHLYLARDMELGNYWAVKELPLEKKREARLLRLLEHPSIPRMVDYVEDGDHCYLIMEYIRGKSLGQMLKEGHVLQWMSFFLRRHCACSSGISSWAKTAGILWGLETG